jgi:tetratricopeptide (TPR) repeat protein
MTLARDYLTRARAAEPDNPRLCLLLGLACGDDGDPQRAKELLLETIRRGGNSYAAHYALGRLFAAEADWESALAEFRLALAARNCPEAHYVVGRVYYQLGRNRLALRQLVKAVEMAPDYGEAFYLLGLVHLRLGERKRAGEAFDAARAVDAKEPRYRTARKLLARAGEVPPPPLFGATRQGRKRLVTGGDDRLAAALQADVLGTEASR